MKQDQAQRLARAIGERMRHEAPLEIGIPLNFKLMLERLKLREAGIELPAAGQGIPEND